MAANFSEGIGEKEEADRWLSIREMSVYKSVMIVLSPYGYELGGRPTRLVSW